MCWPLVGVENTRVSLSPLHHRLGSLAQPQVREGNGLPGTVGFKTTGRRAAGLPGGL